MVRGSRFGEWRGGSWITFPISIFHFPNQHPCAKHFFPTYYLYSYHMTIAVIKTGGKQYKVTAGQELNVEKLAGEVGAKLMFEPLLVADENGDNVEIGTPTVAGKKVEVEIVAHGRDKKVVIIKYRRKTRYRRKAGHRQPFTKIKVGKI